MVYISPSCFRSAIYIGTIPACDGQTDGRTHRCRKQRVMRSVARVKTPAVRFSLAAHASLRQYAKCSPNVVKETFLTTAAEL